MVEQSDEKTLSLDSPQQSRVLVEDRSQQTNYLRDAAEHLIGAMHLVRNQEINPANVNAMCNLAKQIANVVKVNLEVKKSGF